MILLCFLTLNKSINCLVSGTFAEASFQTRPKSSLYIVPKSSERQC